MEVYTSQAKFTSLKILTSKVIKFSKIKMIKTLCKVTNKIINNTFIIFLKIKLINIKANKINKSKNSIHHSLNRAQEIQERVVNKSKKYFSNMSKKFLLLRLSKWLFSRIIIDQRIKTIKVK